MNICIKGAAFLGLGLTAWVVGSGIAAEPEAAAPAKKTVAKLEAPALAQHIDKAVQQRLQSEKIPASPLADDAEFMRRVYLDLVGVIPPADKVAAFLDSKDPEKRAKLIDELLASPQYGKHMADIWQSMLMPRVSDNRNLQRQPLVKWLEDNFNANTPWDKMTTDLLTASGTQAQNGATTFFVANPTADKVNDTVAKLFLGIQLQCAQCHDHPFTGWKQTEYWAMAAFFTKVQTGAARPGQQGATANVSENGNGRQRLPQEAKIVPAKFLQGEEPKIEGSAPRRPVLASWLTSGENQFFARAMVNRTWFQLFGRGFINPVDDMHKDNQASHPEVLGELSQQFVASGFDLKHLIRGICNSQTYQRTSKPVDGNEEDNILFSHVAVKPLTPEQLFDSLEVVVGRVNAPAGGGRPQQGRPQGTPRQAFIAFFSGDEGADPTEYQHGIPQALRLMNSPQLNRDSVLLNEAVKLDSPEKVIEHLYLGTLGRRPSEKALEKMLAHVKKTDNPRKGYGDVLWALLNCSEFTLNH